MAKAWPSSRSPPSSRGCGRPKRSRKTIDEGGTWGGGALVELHPDSRINLQDGRVCEQDEEFTAGTFFCGTVLGHAAILSLDSSDGSTKYLYYT